MRATEASGAGVEGFRARWIGLIEGVRSVSPVSLGITATALLAAALFILSDVVRTEIDAQRFTAIAGATLAVNDTEVFAGILIRALSACGLALAIAGASFRFKRVAAALPEAPVGTMRLLESIREEQRVLARRYHEEKLRAEAASRSKTSFLAHISHDIRTPLNHIIGFAELMRHETYGPLGDTRYLDYVDTIRHSGERLLSFFGSILDLAELEGGRRVLEVADLGVDDLLSAVSRRFAAQAQRARVTLAIGAPSGARLLGDRFSLERMLGNLVDNALRFTPAGGRVAIAAHVASDGVVLEVSDNGIGMSAERVSSLSQPFAFGDAALTKDREGAGLGLAIARTIVELSGGHLAIDSRQGLGTTVAVSLPLHAVDDAEAKAA